MTKESHYSYLTEDLKLYDTVEIEGMKYTVLKDHLSLANKWASGLHNDELFRRMGITNPGELLTIYYWYCPSVSDNQRPYYNVHDYAAASRAVDFLIDKYLHMPSQASGTASAVPLIKVKGKVIEHGQPTAPAVAGPSQDEMLKTIDVAMQVLERASEAAPQQPGQQPGPWGWGQAPQPPRPFLVIYQDIDGHTLNRRTNPVNSISEAIDEFDNRWVSVAGEVILNIVW